MKCRSAPSLFQDRDFALAAIELNSEAISLDATVGRQTFSDKSYNCSSRFRFGRVSKFLAQQGGHQRCFSFPCFASINSYCPKIAVMSNRWQKWWLRLCCAALRTFRRTSVRWLFDQTAQNPIGRNCPESQQSKLESCRIEDSCTTRCRGLSGFATANLREMGYSVTVGSQNQSRPNFLELFLVQTAAHWFLEGFRGYLPIFTLGSHFARGGLFTFCHPRT